MIYVLCTHPSWKKDLFSVALPEVSSMFSDGLFGELILILSEGLTEVVVVKFVK